MKRYVKSAGDISLLEKLSISMILIVDDVNIPTPMMVYADSTMATRQYDEDEIMDMLDCGEISKLKCISDFDNLVRMFHMKEDNPDFTYKFTQKQRDIITEGFKTYSDEGIIREIEVPKLLGLVQECDTCSIPRRGSENAYKNFAEYIKLRLAPEDYLSIIRQFEYSDYKGCVRSFYPNF